MQKIETMFYPTAWTYEEPRHTAEVAPAEIRGRFVGSKDGKPAWAPGWSGEGLIVLPSNYCSMMQVNDFIKVTIEVESLEGKRARTASAMREATPEQLKEIDRILGEE